MPAITERNMTSDSWAHRPAGRQRQQGPLPRSDDSPAAARASARQLITCCHVRRSRGADGPAGGAAGPGTCRRAALVRSVRSRLTPRYWNRGHYHTQGPLQNAAQLCWYSRTGCPDTIERVRRPYTTAGTAFWPDRTSRSRLPFNSGAAGVQACIIESSISMFMTASHQKRNDSKHQNMKWRVESKLGDVPKPRRKLLTAILTIHIRMTKLNHTDLGQRFFNSFS